MAYDPRYGPCAQTPAQRAYVVAQLRITFPRLQPTALALKLYARYIAGELSWLEVDHLLAQATCLPHPTPIRRGA